MSVVGRFALGLVATGSVLGSVATAGTAGAAGSLYGAIAAVSYREGVYMGTAWNYPNHTEADDTALAECGRPGCKVLARFVDGCGAVAESSNGEYLQGGVGPTRAAAERDALARLAQVNVSPFAAFGSSEPASGHIIKSQCTAYAE